MRTIVIGDIHGNLKALQRVLEDSSYDPKVDRLICLGDYVDGYPDSYKVIELLIMYNDISGNKNIYLLGNHDDWFRYAMIHSLKALEDGELDYLHNVYPNWVNQGGKNTILSYINQIDPKPDWQKHLQFFQNLKWYHIENNICFVHAGWDDQLYLDVVEQFKFDKSGLIWDRSLQARASHLQHLLNKGYVPSDEKTKFGGYDKVFIGHTSHNDQYLIDFPDLKTCNVYNLDNGAGHKGRLVAYVLETEEIFRSWKAKLYYKDHMPRQ